MINVTSTLTDMKKPYLKRDSFIFSIFNKTFWQFSINICMQYLDNIMLPQCFRYHWKMRFKFFLQAPYH